MRGRWVLLASLLLVPGTARAESAPVACAYHGSPDVTPPAGSIPADTPLFHIAIYGAAVQWSQITLTRTSDGHVVPLMFWQPQTWGQDPWFSPMEALEAGATYMLQHPSCASLPGRTTTYDVVAPTTPGPTSLGTLTVGGPYVSTFGQHGDCHAQVFYALTLARDPAFAREPWSTFEWGYQVDDTGPLRGWSSVATSWAPLVVDCDGGAVLPGPHRVRASAFPLSTDQTAWAPFRTGELDVDLSCVDPTWVDPMTLAPLVASGIAYWRDDPMGTCSMDGGVPSSIDAAVDGSAHTEPGTQPNCGCGVARADASGWLAWLGAAAWLARRRRVRAG